MVSIEGRDGRDESGSRNSSLIDYGLGQGVIRSEIYSTSDHSVVLMSKRTIVVVGVKMESIESRENKRI